MTDKEYVYQCVLRTYGLDSASVFALPSLSAAITTPFDAASCLNTPIINSLAKIKVTHISPKYGASTGYTTPVEVRCFLVCRLDFVWCGNNSYCYIGL